MTEHSPTSVIIPTFNRSVYLVEALESVLAQTLPPAEIIVADDGSTDDTAERMAPYGDRIRYIRKDNTGKAATLNDCLEIASQEYIWIMDDDDIALPHALETLTKLIRSDPAVGFSYGCYERFSVDKETAKERVKDCGYWQNVPPEQFLIATYQDMFAHHPGMLVKKLAYQTVGPFSLTYPRTEDHEMLIRLASAFPVSGSSKIVFRQRQHDGIRFGGLEADKRDHRWVEEQMALFTALYQSADLASFLPRGSVTSPHLSPAQKREALITRGTIMARKKLWDQAIHDFCQACEIDKEAPLSEREVMAIRLSLFSKFGSSEVLSDKTFVARFRTVAQIGPAGSQIARTLARSMLWFVGQSLRKGDIWRAAQFGQIAFRIGIGRPQYQASNP
ncbi:MAG: glycosyltransferase family 2 protein [Hyphomonas sp.]